MAHLCSPDVVQVLHGKSFLFYNEAKDLLQLLDILRLMQAVPQHNRKDVVLLDPFLMREEQNSFYGRKIHGMAALNVVLLKPALTAMRSAVSHSSSSGLCR